MEGQMTPLYLGRRRYRKLVVLLDADILPESDLTTWGKQCLLAGFLTLDVVKCDRYTDEGPPANAPRQEHSCMGEWVPGWAVLSSDDGSRQRGVRTGDEHQFTDHVVLGNAPDVASKDTTTVAYSDRTPGNAAKQRRADALAAMVASAIGADRFITKRPYLHAVSWDIADGVTFADVDDALAILGLYLRAQEEYVTYRSSDGRYTCRANRGQFFWVGANELLPSARRWLAACVQHSTSGGDERLLFLGQSTIQRVQRALQVRDEVQFGLNRPQDHDTADKVLASLDIVILLLMGAVDATARVAHEALGLIGSPRDAGWQNRRWIKKVTGKAPRLGTLFECGTDEYYVLEVLRLLRNSIHGEAIQAFAVEEQRSWSRTVVGLPKSYQGTLRTAFDGLGGVADWGVEELISEQLHFDAGMFLEQLFPRVITILNRIMDETPVERLDHVSLEPLDSLSPTGSQDGPFIERDRQSILWQLGL